MGFFGDLFGGGDSPPAPVLPPVSKPSPMPDFKAQKEAQRRKMALGAYKGMTRSDTLGAKALPGILPEDDTLGG